MRPTNGELRFHVETRRREKHEKCDETGDFWAFQGGHRGVGGREQEKIGKKKIGKARIF